MAEAVRPFCGREAHLDALRQAWSEVAAGAGPRTLVLLGESGLGKTRLVQEFYAWLVASEQGAGAAGYWPADLAQDGNNLYVNPPESSWDAGAPLPFLWWGIRLTDPRDHNQVVTGALASHVMPYLTPHLEPLARERRRRQRLLEVAKVGGNVALDAALDLVPVLGLLKKVGEVGFELKGIHDAWRKDRQTLTAQELASEQRTSLVDEVIADLGKLFSGQGADPVPAVIVVDDAQFSASDAGMVAFCSALIEAMTSGRWPVLLLVTHWQREWALQVEEGSATIASLLEAARSRHGNVDLVPLGPVDDLAPLLAAELPGLEPQQASAILERVGGNPRFLDEVLRLVELGGRGLFVGRDPTGPLTAAGLEELLAASVGLHELVRNRLIQSPDEVQKAVVIAGLQGAEFLGEMVTRTAAALSEDVEELRAAVDRAESPHAYFASTFPGFAAFAQPIYQEVASQRLRYWYDPDEARLAVEEAVRAGMRSAREMRDPRHVVALYDQAARLFEGSEEVPDRLLAAHALYWLCEWAHRRREVHAMRALALRLAAVLGSVDDDDLENGPQDGPAMLRSTALWLSQFGAAETRLALLERAERLAGRESQLSQDGGAARRARAVADLAALLQELGDRRGAGAAWDRAAEAASDLGATGDDPFALEAGALVHAGRAYWLLDEGHLEAAEKTFAHCLQLLDRLPVLDPDGRDRYRSRELTCRIGLAGCAMVGGDYARAQDELRVAVGVARGHAAAAPGPESDSQLAAVLHRLSQAILLEGGGPDPEAASCMREALALARSNSERLPGVVWTRSELATLLEASRVHDMSEPDGPDLAWAHVREALSLRREVADAGGHGLARWDLARCLLSVADVAYARGDLEAASSHAEEGLGLTRAEADNVGEAAGAMAVMSAIALAALTRIALDDLAGAGDLIADADRLYPVAAAASPSMAAALMGRVEGARAALQERLQGSGEAHAPQ